MVSLLLVLLLVVPGQSDGVGKKKKKNQNANPPEQKQKTDEPENINPRGRFDGDIIDRRPQFFLWLEGDMWHIRTGSAGKKSTFIALIKVHNGRFKSHIPMGIEKKSASDSWSVNKEKTVLAFTVQTAGKADGFNFQIEGDDAILEFDLTVNGQKTAERVSIGPNKRHPSQVPFRLVSNPPESNEKPKEKPKKKAKKTPNSD